MRPSEINKYEKPTMRSFASADELIAHYAERGDPVLFNEVLEFTKECERKREEYCRRKERKTGRR